MYKTSPRCPEGSERTDGGDADHRPSSPDGWECETPSSPREDREWDGILGSDRDHPIVIDDD